MVTVGIGILWLGYGTLAYGLASVRGCNPGFLALFVPGKFAGCKADADAGTGGNTPAFIRGGAGLTKDQRKAARNSTLNSAGLKG